MPQNIPLRGHRENAKNDPKLGKSDLTNFGNLLEPLFYRDKGGNRKLENHVHKCPKNAQYFIIYCCFSDISRQTTMLVSYFLCFTTWLIYSK